MSTRPPRLWPWILIPVLGLVALAAFAIVGFFTVGAAGASPWPWWGFFPWFPIVGMAIFFGFLCMVFVFRCFGGPWGWEGGPGRGNDDRSGAILRERYAHGEITKEEFDAMRRDLNEHLTQNAYESEAARRAGP